MFSPDILRLAEKIVTGFTEAGKKVVTAESCTGGLIAAALTEIPGASAVVERGFIAYSNASKTEVLGILPDYLEFHGAVSGETVEAMAVGALEFSLAHVAVAVTGIAGPGGGDTLEKPVGLVYIGIALRGGITFHSKCNFSGSRTNIRMQSVREALTMLSTQLGDKNDSF